MQPEIITHEGTHLTARYFFAALDMGYEEGFFREIDPMGAVKEHPEALQKTYDLGEKVVRNDFEQRSTNH